MRLIARNSLRVFLALEEKSPGRRNLTEKGPQSGASLSILREMRRK